MDEEQTRTLLGPTPDHLASMKVFPLIIHLKKDVLVRACLLESMVQGAELSVTELRGLLVRVTWLLHEILSNAFSDSALSWEYVNSICCIL